MKILISASYGPSLINFRGKLIEDLTGLGHRVVCVAPETDSSLASEIAEKGGRYLPIELIRSRLGVLADFRYFISLVRLLSRERPDMVLSYTLKPIVYTTLAAAVCRVPRRYVMVTGLGFAFSGGRSISKWIARACATVLLGVAFRVSSGAIFQNRVDVDELSARWVLPKRVPVVVIAGSGVDVTVFQPRASERSAQRGHLSFLLIARLIREKGILEFADAIERLRQMGADVSGTIVAPLDPSPVAIGVETMRSLVGRGCIRWVPGARDVRPFLDAADVFVLPSYYREGVPRTLLEALAMAKAIITTDMPGCRDTVLDAEGTCSASTSGIALGRNGILVRPQSVCSLAHAMTVLLENRDMVTRMGMASRELALRHFDVTIVNKEILDFIGVERNGDGC